ncbi:chemotaxis protein CheW [Pseudoalteromonas distincta]|uniref:chemotaxis protein CheW n=1 Tax=Pseudoalteromonas distincta TaxID=77608 RepID=UPI0032E074C9
MSKQLFANEKVMKQYLGALLCEEEPLEELEPVAKLLENISGDPVEEQEYLKVEELKPEDKMFSEELTAQEATLNVSHDKTVVMNGAPISGTALDIQAEHELSTQSQEKYFDSEFQALFFEVAGLTIAVPLKALGGIHQLGEVNHLFGKPKWFKGVMLNRDENLNVVDTACWVMPEKYDEKLESSLNYQYLITLGDSRWGLLAEKLINNITLSKEDVKWRTDKSKRPWLAGVIKEKMCALIDVDNLNILLEKGLDSRD